jgi:cytochrome c biogenesis protein
MKQRFFRFLADLRFAIFILLLISSCSIIGTVIEQDQSIETYKLNYPLTNQLFGFLSWDRILQFGLDHVYKTWWFLTLILLFGASLITCTFLQQLPSLKIARRCQFFRTTEQFCRLKLSTILNDFNLNKVLSRLQQNQYSIFQQKNIVYCYKGLIGRIAPIIVHLSMILVLIGTIMGSLFGFKAQEIIPKTETFHIQNVVNNGQLTIVPKISARINDFWITYTKQKTISQFYSDISILNNDGNEIERKTSFVNSPLIYKGIYYYQTDWNLTGLRFQDLNSQIVEYPLVNILSNKNKVWLTWIPSNPNLNEGIILIIDNLQGYCSVYNDSGIF